MKKLHNEVKATTNAARDLYYTMERVKDALYLDLLLLEAEAEVGLMDGIPLPGGKKDGN